MTPKYISGNRTAEDILRAYHQKLEEQKNKTPRQEPRKVAQAEVKDLRGHIYIPKIDLYVAKEKTLHGKDWHQSHAELHKQGMQMLTIPQFIEFVKYLKLEPRNQEYQKILDEILTVRDPMRAEWLDADFKVVNGTLHANYSHRTINGKLQPQNSEPLDAYLMEDKTPGINLDYWLNNATAQGLPPKNTPKGNLWYWHPRNDNNSVARFIALSVGAYLYCGSEPQYSDSALGVRVAKIK